MVALVLDGSSSISSSSNNGVVAVVVLNNDCKSEVLAPPAKYLDMPHFSIISPPCQPCDER